MRWENSLRQITLRTTEDGRRGRRLVHRGGRDVGHGHRGEDGRRTVLDHRTDDVVVDDRHGVRVPLGRAVREVATDPLGVHHRVVLARQAHRPRHQVLGDRGHVEQRFLRLGVRGNERTGLGGGQGDGGQQQRYHDDLHVSDVCGQSCVTEWNKRIGSSESIFVGWTDCRERVQNQILFKKELG